MRDREEAEGEGEGGVIVNQRRWSFNGQGEGYNGGGFNGVLAEDRLTAFELWRTICMYL